MLKQKFINLKNPRQNELRKLFQAMMSLDPCGQAKKGEVLAVSVFDHWLSEDEADTLLAEVTSDEQIRRNHQHFSLLKRLVAETEVLSYRISGRRKSKIIFREFGSIEECFRYLEPLAAATSVQDRFSIALPELMALYVGGYDDTNYLYYLDEARVGNFKRWVVETGLHII